MNSAHSPEAIKKEVRTYFAVFAALAVLTVVTVSASYLHLSIGGAVVLALFIATVKGTLVAAFFMHLRAEKMIIWYILILAAFFFLFLLFSPSLHLL